MPTKPATDKTASPSSLKAEKEQVKATVATSDKAGEDDTNNNNAPPSFPPPPPVPSPKNIVFLKQRRGTIEPLSHTVIEFTIQPQTPGRQTHSLCVRNLLNGLEGMQFLF